MLQTHKLRWHGRIIAALLGVDLLWRATFGADAADVAGQVVAAVAAEAAAFQNHPVPLSAWTGLEYVLAMGLAQHGETALAADTVAAVRERFDGARRNPFDEAECGHHYARALASWGVVVALTGFGYDGRSGVMSFAAADPPAFKEGNEFPLRVSASYQFTEFRKVDGMTFHQSGINTDFTGYFGHDFALEGNVAAGFGWSQFQPNLKLETSEIFYGGGVRIGRRRAGQGVRGDRHARPGLARPRAYRSSSLVGLAAIVLARRR